MRVQLSRRSADDRGAVAVVVALMGTFFLILAAFAVDIGNAWAQGRQLSVSADAASLAAAKKVGDAYTSTSCTADGLTAINADSIATAEAIAVNNRNNRSATNADVVTAHAYCSADGTAILVDVTTARDIQTGLGALVGISTMHPNAAATGRYVRTVLGMLRPWAMCTGTLSQAQNDGSVTFAAPMDNKWGICGSSSSGNWGSVDFDGGGNPATDLVNWTRFGYQGPMPTVPGDIPADPGISASQLGVAFTAIVNTPILLPVASNYVDPLNGNNGTFQTNKLALVTFCGAYYQNKTYATDASGNPSTCWVNPVPTVTTTTTTQDFLATGGSIAKGANVLTVTAPSPFFTDTTWLNNANVVVTVPGAGGGGKDLVSQITGFTNGTTAVLATKAGTTVANVPIKVTVTTITTTTSPTPAPLDSHNQPYNQLQFRWLRTYETSAAAAIPCDLNDTLCHGVVTLYK